MKLTLIASLFAASATLTLAHPHGDHQDGPSIEERQTSTVITTGAGGSAVYPRLELRQMKSQQPNQYTLLMLALQSWQAESQSSDTSYFGISRIHGVPDQDYNGVGQCSSCGDADGYCTHNLVLFPGWHRVYVALFEQQFLTRVNAIANKYTGSQKATMLNASATMRWPYWDWAAIPPPNAPVVPTIVTSKTITVNGPSGQVTIPSPFYQYNFTDPSGLVYYPFTSWPATLRYPSSNDPGATSAESQVVANFKSARASLADQVYQLFTTCTDFAHFSNDAADSSSTGCSNSIEGIHNTVHMTAGGTGDSNTSGGHMAYLPLASFDPLFWLHHANVDRIFAMWQALNPTSYGSFQAAQGDTWTIATNSVQGPDSPLTPFYKDSANNFWTTNQVRNWSATFKYTYPEFANSKGDKAAIASYAKKLYGPSATATAGSSKRTAMPEAEAEMAQPEATAAAVVLERAAALLAPNGSSYQYVANVQTPRYALNGSYTIYLFLGAPAGGEVPTGFGTAANLVGPVGVVSHAARPGRSAPMQEILITGSVPLTRSLTALVRSGQLAGLTEALVTPYLKQNLQWRVVDWRGKLVDSASIPGFAVSVAAATAQESADPSVLPVYSPFVTLVEATDGLAGGLNKTTSLLGQAYQGLKSLL